MAVRQYIGARYMPKFLGTYDPTQAYEALSVVDNGSGTTYVCNQPTPPNTPLTDGNYWILYGSSSGAILHLQEQIDDMNDGSVPGSLQSQIDSNDTDIGNINIAITNLQYDVSNIKFDIIVDAGGSGDYTTLTAAVAAANTGDKILVKAGTYNNETVDAQSKKLVIIGEDKFTTKIWNSYDDYYRAPIEIGNGYVANLTFESTGSGGNPPSYGAHIDYQSMTNSQLVFENCKFSSISTFAVGVGMRNHGSLIFKDCEFISQSATTGCFFVHPSTDTSNYGSDQMLTCINCTFTSASGVAITTSKHGDNTNIVYALFEGCYLRVSGGAREGLIFQSDNGVDTGKVIFLKGSGNNYPFLNQDTYHSSVATVGRWNDYAVKRKVYSGTCSAGVQGSFDLPSDCSLVLEYIAYFKHGSIWYPAGVKNDASATDYHNAYYVNESNQKKGYYKSVSDGSYQIVLTYVSDNVQFV